MWGDADVLKQWYADSGDGYTVLGIVRSTGWYTLER